MTSLNSYPYPERVLAAILLEEIYTWQDKYEEKLKDKYPNINEEELREKILNAKTRKFRSQYDKILFIKLKRLKEAH